MSASGPSGLLVLYFITFDLMIMLSSATFFKTNFFQKNLSGTLSGCQTVWIQIRTNVMSVLIWVQIICKGYQERVK